MKTSKIPMSAISVVTSLYYYDYNKEPKGRGCWAFSIGSKEACRDVSKASFTDSMTYREAVRVAKEEAQKRGATIIYVLP